MKTKCMSCGGSMKKMAVGGTTTKRIIKKSTGGMYGIPQENLGTSGQYGFAKKGGTVKKYQKGGYTDPNKYVMNKTNIFGNSKFKEISKNKFDRVSNRYAKQEGSESLGTNESIGQQVISGRNKKNYVSRVDEVRKAESNKKIVPRVRPTKNVPPTKTSVPLMKKGGTNKAAKFAALAPPYDKATFADKIVGAKKSVGSKKLPKAQLGGILKMAIRATKPLTKTLKPIAKKIVSKSKTTATKKFNYPKDKVKSMFPRVADDVKKYNSETNPQKLFERKTIKEQMKQWDKAAELKQQKKYPVLKNKN